MTDYWAKAQQREYEYAADCRRKHSADYAHLETFAELENELKQKRQEGAYTGYLLDQRVDLMRDFFLKLLFANGFRLDDDGLWVFPEETKKKPEGC